MGCGVGIGNALTLAGVGIGNPRDGVANAFCWAGFDVAGTGTGIGTGMGICNAGAGVGKVGLGNAVVAGAGRTGVGNIGVGNAVDGVGKVGFGKPAVAGVGIGIGKGGLILVVVGSGIGWENGVGRSDWNEFWERGCGVGRENGWGIGWGGEINGVGIGGA